MGMGLGGGGGFSRSAADRWAAARYLSNPAPQIAVFGHSIARANTIATVSGGIESFSARGPIVQAVAQLKGRVRFQPSMNFGVDEDTSAMMLARIQNVIDSPADIVVVTGPTNDFDVGGLTSEQSRDNMTAIYTQLLDAGKIVLAEKIMPRGLWYNEGAATQSRLQHYRWNAWLDAYGYQQAHRSFYVVNTDSTIINLSSATGDHLSGALRDGLHPNVYGAELIAGANGGGHFAVLDRILPPRIDALLSPADLYDATYNPYGSLTLNPRMTGSSGTAGTGVTGSVPTNFSVQRDTGTVIQATTSLVTADALRGGQALKLALGASGLGAATERLRVTGPSVNAGGTTFASGDYVYAEALVDQASLAGVQNIGLMLLDNDGATNRIYYDCHPTDTASNREYPTLSRRFRTPEIPVWAYSGSGTQSLHARLIIDAATNSSAPSGDVTIYELAVRKAVSL